VRYTNEAIKAAVELSARYIHDRKLPDKAIDVIDEAGAAQMLLPRTSARRRSASRKSRPRSPPWRASRPRACRRTTEVLKNLERNLKRVVFGQDKAIEALRLRSSWRAPACATGKADRLLPVLRPDRRRQDRSGQAARHRSLGVELIRFDMSEYMERTRCRA
jgi:ATP-dependent Clp protease ATP-binding subunit ClpA